MSYDPLETCPTDLRHRYEGMAKRAPRELAVAVRLKCLECAAWQPAEVPRCEITGCALWARRGGRSLKKLRDNSLPKRPEPEVARISQSD